MKVGDKVIDSSGVLFSITAIDTQNSTFTIGTALIDLAQDSDVVHKSGNETVGGSKTFDSNTYIYNSDNTATTPNLYLRSSKIEISSQGNTSGDQNLTYLDKNSATYAYVKGAIQSNGSAVKIRAIAKDSSDNSVISELQLFAYTNGKKAIFPSYSNEVDLGISGYKWKSIFATNYYYGNDNVEFSTKFVTTDTTQNISGAKAFNSNTYIYNPDATGNTPNLFFKSSKAVKGDTSGSNNDSIRISHVDKNDKLLSYIQLRKVSNGSSDITLYCSTQDANNQDISSSITLFKAVNGQGTFRPVADNDVNLGNSTYKWKDVNTYLVNGLEPSSLSLPSDRSARIDISSYFTNTGDNEDNEYVASANGYIFLDLGNVGSVFCSSLDSNNYTNYKTSNHSGVYGVIQLLFPIIKGNTAKFTWRTNSTVTIYSAYFIPCQGNV